MPTPRLTLEAMSLSALAGFVDAIAFIYLGGYFVSFMSGNTTQGGVQLAQGASGWQLALELVGCFVLGVILGALVGRVRRLRSAAIVGLVAVVLAVATAVVTLTPAGRIGILGLAVAMGAVNVLFARDGVTLGLTYVTGALVKVGEGIVAALSGGPRWAWVLSLLLWVGIAGGAVLGGLAYGALGTTALWIAVGVALAIAAGSAVRESRAGRRSKSHAVS